MANVRLDLSLIGGHRVGRQRRAWVVVGLAALCTLLAAGALEWINRAALQDAFQHPLSGMDIAALRDLTTALAWQEIDPMSPVYRKRLIAVADRHPDNEVTPYALWMAAVDPIPDKASRLDLALKAARAAKPGTRYFAVTHGFAARLLKQLGQSDDAISLLEQAIGRGEPSDRPTLLSNLLSTVAERRGPQAVLDTWQRYVVRYPSLANEWQSLVPVARAHERLGQRAQAVESWKRALAATEDEDYYWREHAREVIEHPQGEATVDGH